MFPDICTLFQIPLTNQKQALAPSMLSLPIPPLVPLDHPLGRLLDTRPLAHRRLHKPRDRTLHNIYNSDDGHA